MEKLPSFPVWGPNGVRTKVSFGHTCQLLHLPSLHSATPGATLVKLVTGLTLLRWGAPRPELLEFGAHVLSSSSPSGHLAAHL